jgi:hypothetical protein
MKQISVAVPVVVSPRHTLGTGVDRRGQGRRVGTEPALAVVAVQAGPVVGRTGVVFVAAAVDEQVQVPVAVGVKEQAAQVFLVLFARGKVLGAEGTVGLRRKEPARLPVCPAHEKVHPAVAVHVAFG